MPEITGYAPGSFCWIELNTSDPARAKEFYQKLFDWKLEDAGRLAVLVAFDHAARDLEVAVRVGERRGVEPERVVVARHQRRGRVAGDLVERLLRRLCRRRPVAGAPAHAAQPAARLGLFGGSGGLGGVPASPS